MAQQHSFKCPKCEKSFKLKPALVGKKVSCSNCTTVFRIAAPSVSVTNTPAPQKQRTPKPVDLSQSTLGSADLMRPLSAPTGASTDPNAPVLARAKRPKATASNTSYKKLAARKKKKTGQEELTEQDMQVQSAGITMVCLVIASAVLPLLGLQLRRLNKLGEYAPLAGMFLGLIGVGCICYARRNRKDVLPLAGAALATVLMFGIGGFVMQRQINIQTVADNESNDERSINQPNKNRQGPLGNSSAKSELMTPRNRSNNGASAKTLSGGPQEAIASVPDNEAAVNSTVVEPKEEMSIGNGSNRRKRNDPRIKKEIDSENPFDGGAVKAKEADKKNSGADKPSVRNHKDFKSSLWAFDKADVRARWQKGSRPFMDAVRSKGDLGRGLKIEEVVGRTDRFGKLFTDKKPITGLETMLISVPMFIPCYATDELSKNAIVADIDGKELIGFNLAQDQDEFVGIQGIYADVVEGKRDYEKLTTGHWLGRETELHVELKTKKAIHGFAIHGDLACYGMSLITK